MDCNGMTIKISKIKSNLVWFSMKEKLSRLYNYILECCNDIPPIELVRLQIGGHRDINMPFILIKYDMYTDFPVVGNKQYDSRPFKSISKRRIS